MHVFTTEMLIFSNFVQRINFEQSEFQKVCVALAEFYLFQLLLLWVLGESCFTASKVLLE